MSHGQQESHGWFHMGSCIKMIAGQNDTSCAWANLTGDCIVSGGSVLFAWKWTASVSPDHVDLVLMLSSCLQEQVTNMTNKWHIYMTFDGRISMAGLSASRCSYLAKAMIDSYTNC